MREKGSNLTFVSCCRCDECVCSDSFEPAGQISQLPQRDFPVQLSPTYQCKLNTWNNISLSNSSFLCVCDFILALLVYTIVLTKRKIQSQQKIVERRIPLLECGIFVCFKRTNKISFYFILQIPRKSSFAVACRWPYY